MLEIQYLTGDATDPIIKVGNRIIIHICNDIGAWGAGFVLALSKRWKQPEESYRQWYADRNRNNFALGAFQLVQIENNLSVANLIGQHGIYSDNRGMPPIRYEALKKSLISLVKDLQNLEDVTIHMPKIGCGLAGGSWDKVEEIINSTLIKQGYPCYVYLQNK